VEVARAGGLSGENHAAAGGGGTGEASLSAEHGVRADIARVADENEVVDFCAVADTRFADGGAVDASVGLDFDVVFENSRAGLDDFVPGAVFAFGEAEAVGSDDGAVLENDAIANAAKFADDAVRVREEIVADLRAAIDRDGTVQDGVFADHDIFVDETVGTDVGVRSDFRGGGDDGGGMDAGRVGRRLIEKFERFGEGEVGIVAANESEGRRAGIAGYGCGVVDKDGGGASRLEQGSVALVGEEGDLAGPSVFEASYAGDFEIRGGIEAAIEFLGKVRQLHGRRSCC